MSLVSEIKDPFRTAAMVTAFNVRFTTLGLANISTTFGIARSRWQMAFGAQLPEMAVECGAARVLNQYSGGEHRLAAPVTVYIAHAATSYDDLLDDAEEYFDAFRLVVEQQLNDTFTRLTWTGGDPQGRPWTDDPDVPDLMLAVGFEVEFIYQEESA